MRRLGGALALALAFAVGCGDAGLTEGAEGGDVTVSNHPALLFSPPWIAAQDQKLFQKHGLNVKQIVGSEGGGTTVRNVVSGGLPIGEVATTAAITAFNAGADIRIVGGGVASSKDSYWVVRKDSPLESIEDLKGKKVGYTSPGSVSQGLLALSLERSGVGVDNVEMRTMGGLTEGLTALKQGDIDAAAILEPVYSEQAEEEGWKIVFKASDYVPEFLSTVVITGPGVLETGPRAGPEDAPGPRRRHRVHQAQPRTGRQGVGQGGRDQARIGDEGARGRRPGRALGGRARQPEGARDRRRGDAPDRPAARRPEDRLGRLDRPGLHPARPADRAARRLRVLLDVENVSKTYGDVEAMRDVSLAVDEGEFVSIVGPSRVRQEHADGDRRRADRADRGHDHDRRHARPGHRSRGRHRLPAGVRVPVAHGRGERRLRPGDDRRRQGRSGPSARRR